MFSKEERREICYKAVRTFGENAQCIKAMEECGELVHALARKVLDQDPDLDNICEEIADVEILMEQMRVVFGDAFIDKWKEKKLKKLEGVVW